MDKKHKEKISKALKGKPKSEEHKKKISDSAKKRNIKPENNPNYKGDDVGYVGIHLWLRNNFKKNNLCLFCKEYKRTVWAKIQGKYYERKRENFIEICYKCHRRYDDTKKWRKNISKAKLGIKTRFKYKHSDEAKEKISLSKKGKKRPDVSERNKLKKRNKRIY